MKKITLLLLLVLARFAAFGQCTPNLTVAYTDPSAPVLCADPATGLYIVDPAYELEITLEDAVGAPLTFTLNNNDWIYVAPGQTGPLPNPGGASGQTSPPLPSVYWNGNPHAGGAGNTNPDIGAQDYTSYQYTGTFTIPGCGQDTFDITLITTGFTYDDLCRGDVKDLTDLENDIPILGNYPSITWYDDAAGTTALPSNTQLQFNEIYYADLGLGCALVPVQISSKSPVPEAASVQEFCTAATWAAAGFPAQPGDTVEDLIICGQNLTWYSDAAGTTVIPTSTALVQGQTYYVSQTVLGCESDLLAITVTEQECACLENSGFQDQGGNFNPAGFDFYSNSFGSISACQGMDYMPGATLINGASIPANDQAAAISYATAGNNIPVLTPYSVYVPTTSPFGCSANSIKLNDNTGGGRTVGILEKEFIAGEVLVFDFALVFENPADHAFDDQPFMTIRVFDENGNLVQTRCVVSNPEDCIFNIANPGATDLIIYSTWSCIKLNTGELQGQKAKLQVTIGDCDLSGHWATGYLDNFYTGDDVAGVCDDSAFGYLSIVPVDDGTDPYASCSLFDVPQDPNCAPALPALNPQFPIDVYFDYDTPIGGQLNELQFDIFDSNGNKVYTPVPSTVSTDPVTGYYYYTINQTDIPAGFGAYNFVSNAEYVMNNCGGTQPYTYPVQAISNGFKICPTAGCPPAVSFCGTTGSSFSVDLEDPNTQSAVLDGMNASDLSFTYWTDQNDALNGSGPSQIPAANINNYTVTTSTTVYIRLDAIPAIADCYDVVPLDILIGDVPAVPATIANMNICGGGTVDLTTQDAAASAQATITVSVTYFDDLNNAQNNLSPIANPTNYSPAVTTTVYARVENAEGCYEITTFDVVVGTPPNYNPPANLAECDLGTQDGFTQFDLNAAANQIIGGNPNTSVDFYETQAGADAQDPNDLLPLNYTNTTANQQTIYVYIEDTSNGCYVVEPLTLDVTPAPVANPAGPLFACDNDGDGSEDFVLTAMDNTISGGGANLAVTYHASLANAQAGTAALNSPYTASGATTTIYARLEDTSGAGCYDTVAIDLEIGDAPNLPASIPNLEACDDAQNGVQTFDLTSQAAAITANMANPAGASLTYYASQTDYNSGTPIPGANLTAYDNISNPQSIVVEVEGANTCIATISFDLVVNPLPTYNTPNLYSICDQGAQDGLATFDLSVATAQITAGFANLNLSYYELQADANAANTNTLANNYDNTTPYNQTIYVLIEDTTTGCTMVDQLDLEVVASPTVNPAGPLELCDANLDGSETFILASLTATIEGGAAGSVTTTYHPTQADADNATATLPMNYSTVTTTVYARVEDNGPAGCYNTIAVNLNVLPSPDLVTNLPALEACDDAQNGVQTFDLTSQSAAILANEATPANFTLT
ncbi:hypothetical protein, partial [Mesonia sp. HuA40]|uniref:hypothetical protein n=1 Tax=Mesonia sp. HuA40 TaxID=2602761 RepID=UPI0011C81921